MADILKIHPKQFIKAMERLAKSVNTSAFDIRDPKFFVRVNASDGKVTFTGSDNMTIMSISESDPFSNGIDLYFPLTQTLRILKSLKGDKEIEFRITKQWANLESGGSKFRFPLRQFGTHAVIDDRIKWHVKIKSDYMLKGLRGSQKAVASKASGTFVLTALCFSVNNDILKMNATDGTKLAQSIFDIENPSEITEDFLVPQEAIPALTIAAEGDPEGFLDLGITDNGICVTNESTGISMYVRSISGKYPNVELLLKDTYDVEVEIEAKSLSEAMKKALLFSEVSIDLNLHKTGSSIYATGQNLGFCKESVILSKMKGLRKADPEIGIGILVKQIIGIIDEYGGVFKIGLVAPGENGMVTRPIQFVPKDLGFKFNYLILPVARLSAKIDE